LSLIGGAGGDLGPKCGMSVAFIALRSKTELFRRGGTVANPYSQNMTLDTMNSKGDSTGALKAAFSGVHSSIFVFQVKGKKGEKIEIRTEKI
jgi:hypothetical protein